MSIRAKLHEINERHAAAKRACHEAQIVEDGAAQEKAHREMLGAEEARYTLRNEIADVFLFMLRVTASEKPGALAAALAATDAIAKLEAFMVQQKHKERGPYQSRR